MLNVIPLTVLKDCSNLLLEAVHSFHNLCYTYHCLTSPFFPLQLLLAFQSFGATLEEFLHMILPYVVKLFDAPDVPLPVRRTALETVDHFADYLDLTDYTSKIIHPLVCLVVLNY